MLEKYTLKAKLNSKTNRKTIWADREGMAIIQAIMHIMDNGHKDQKGPWAIGQIELTNSVGEIIHEMKAKA